ncbi:MAG: alginate export family protein [Nitrospinota bacterium]|nr:alginate export family protein [Nitrospinota bacterium]
MKRRRTALIYCFALLMFAGPWLAPGESGQALATQVTVSGQLRVRPEVRDNVDFDSSQDDTLGFWGSRARVSFGAQLDEQTSALITLQDSRNWGQKAGGAQSGREMESLDIFEAYFQMKKLGGLPVGVKLGRQSLVYGDQRLLGDLDWGNSGRAHDALKLMIELNMASIDIFTTKENDPTLHTSDGGNDDELTGVYAMAGLAEGITLDLYAMKWKTAVTVVYRDMSVHALKAHDILTYGARVAFIRGALDATAEVVFQSGKWAEGVNQVASAMAFTAGFRVDALGGARLGLEYAIGSGDGVRDDNQHKTFVFPFHNNHTHYGKMDYFSWGNMQDIALKLATGPMAGGYSLNLDFHMFYLYRGGDDWLNAEGVAPFKTWATDKFNTEAGSEIDVTLSRSMSSAWTLTAGYSAFMPGAAAEERASGRSDASHWAYIESSLEF